MSVRQGKDAVTIATMGDVLFGFDKADILAAAEPTLRDIAKLIKSPPPASSPLKSHGLQGLGLSITKGLSLRRAQAVQVQWLGAHRVGAAKLSVRGLRATRPVQ